MVAVNTPKNEVTRYVTFIQSVVVFASVAAPSVGGILMNWTDYRGLMLVSGIMVAVAVLLVYLLVEEQQKLTTGTQPTSMLQDFRIAFKKPILVTVLCSEMVYGFVAFASQPILILYVQGLIRSRVNLFTGLICSSPGLAIVMTNYFWCCLGEKHTFQRIIFIGLAGAVVFTILQGMVWNIWWFAAAYFLAGMFAAAVSPNTTDMIATRMAGDFQSRAFALQQSSRAFGSFFGPILVGFLGDFLPLQWVFSVVGILGMIAVTALQIQMSVYRHSER
jgi:DHA1 family bicyclomycin/chloramphenicol resistance-like MFS transporter